MLKRTTLAKSLLIAFGGSAALYGGAALAQQTTQELQRVTVTGSNIKRTDTETASPVQVLSRDDIEKTGKQSIQEVLRGLTGDNQGSIPTAFSGGFASGSAAVSLRGLGVNSTLVLVNGRRMTTYGLADDGSRTFVDVNSIPLEAVERIEVLKDGASAIYGSDAVGGVVNIIMRSNYTGIAAGGSVGTSYKGDGTTTRAFGSVGFGDISTDKYNLFFTLEGSHQKSIFAADRGGFLGTNDLRSIGYFDSRRGSYAAGFGEFADGSGPAFSSTTPYGTVRVPGGTQSQRINLTSCPEINPLTGVCTFDTIAFTQIQPNTNRLNLFSRGAFQISPSMEAFAELGVFYAKTSFVGTPGSVNDTGVYNPADPLNPLVAHTTTLPAGHPDNPTGVNRTLSLLTTDLGGRNGIDESTVTRLIAGLKGNAFTWNYEIGAGYIGSRLRDIKTGYVRYSVLQQALNDGTYRVNQPGLVPQSLRDAISPELDRTATSSVSLIDFKVDRELMTLPGGALSLALGGEYRKEKADTPPTPYTDTSDIVGLGYSAYTSSRSVKALYGELNASVFKWLELNAAARYDKYSDYGNSTTPKVGFKIKPIDQFAIRGTYSEAFRAPGPTESGNSSSLGFTNIAIISIGDPSVKPETAKSYTLGLILEPLPGTSATLDYYRVKRKDEIVQADQATILAGAPNTGTPSSKIPGAQPNSFIYYDDTGALAAVSGPYANAAKTNTDGIDLEIRQKFSLGDAGKLTGQLNYTHVNSFKRVLADGTEFEYAGTHGPYVLSSAAGTPKDRASFSLTWDRGPWTLTGQMNYVSGMDAIDHKGESMVDNGDGTFSTTTNEGAYFTDGTKVCGVFYPNGDPAPNAKCRVASFTTFDLFGKYSGFKEWEITGSIQNLFNRKPPFDPYTYGGVNYNPTFHQAGAVGTFVTIGAKYTFK
jgi:iron complex outermembrane recepter protein